MEVGLLVLAYFLGALPFGFLVGKANGIDIRRHGSGNIGTTNVFRILGSKAGTLVLAGDVLKGISPVVIARVLFPDNPNLALISGLLAIVGHNWSVFLGLKGGKGVATGAGVILSLAPKVLVVCFVIWLVVVAASRYVSLGSIVAVIFLPVMMILFRLPWSYTVFGSLAALVVIYQHRSNIQRLIKGTESRVGRK